MIQIRSKKQRKKLNKILLEGTRLITDALEAGMIPESIIYSRVLDLKKLPIPKENTIAKYKVPYRTIQLWSTLTTPSGLMGKLIIIITQKFKVYNFQKFSQIFQNTKLRVNFKIFKNYNNQDG